MNNSVVINHKLIELWAKIGKAALDNPELPVTFIRDLLITRTENPDLTTPFVPEGQKN